MEGKIVCVAESMTFLITENKQSITPNWSSLCKYGSEEHILAAMKDIDFHQHDVNAVSSRLAKEGFYCAVVETLESRFIYSHTIWSWSLYHCDLPRITRFLQLFPNIESHLGPYFTSSFFSIDPRERNLYSHLEFGTFHSPSTPFLHFAIFPFPQQRDYLHYSAAQHDRKVFSPSHFIFE